LPQAIASLAATVGVVLIVPLVIAAIVGLIRLAWSVGGRMLN
jgi:hypothetical protein